MPARLCSAIWWPSSIASQRDGSVDLAMCTYVLTADW